ATRVDPLGALGRPGLRPGAGAVVEAARLVETSLGEPHRAPPEDVDPCVQLHESTLTNAHGAGHEIPRRPSAPSRVCPPPATGANRSPCLASRSQMLAIVQSPLDTEPSSDQAMGTDTGAPGRGLTE